MRKKWITVLATLFTCATLALGFTACGDGNTSAGSSNTNPEQSSSEQEQPPAHEHEYTTEITAPTCTEQGYTTYTCECGHSYVDTYVDALNHDFTDYKPDNNATYTSDGTKTATCNREGCEEKDTVTDEGTKLASGISFRTLSVNGTNVYGKVSNTTATFSFISEITAVGTAKFVVSLDILGVQQVATKTIPLEIGDNTVYITETVDSEPVNVYTVTLRRRPMYEVTFNANGGTAVEKQTVEEDFCATEPTTTRAGYTFTAWDYDFATPITKNTAVTASWTANTNTPYKVEYYLQNLEDDNYTLKETANKTGETDTTANAEIKTFTHFTHKASSTDSGNIDCDGSTVLKVYYTRDSYDIVANGNNAKAGTSTKIDGNYRFEKEFTVTATTNAGYTWLGWYDGETLVCATEEFTFKAEKDVTYTATWKANEDTKYTVNYYWQNIDDDNYTLHEYVELTGETDTTATAAVKEYEHFTYNESQSMVSGNIDGDGSTVLKVYYTRNKYTLSINNSSAGSITNKGTYKYGKEITTTASLPNLGYDFWGWYSGETLLSTDLTYTFTAIRNVTAKFEVKAEMSNFNFSSTATTCSITGSNSYVTKIVIPNYVTSIGSFAFDDCYSITSVVIGNGVTSIGSYAFRGCSSLTSVVIGDSVTSIGDSAFRNCSSLTSIEIPDGVTRIGSYAFYGCSSLTSIEIPDSVTSIGSFAFDDCYSITSVVIGNGVTSIGSYAFRGCSSLTSVVIGDSVTSIGDSAFRNCSSLTSIEIPDNVTTIGSHAFENCSSLTEMTLPFVGASKAGTSDMHFGYIFGASSYSGNNYDVPTSLKKVTITGGVISSYAFYDCSGLTSIEIPDSVTRIGSYAFYGCSSLTSIEIPDGVTRIGSYAFYGCYSLKSIEIPDGVTSIGSYAFYNCSGLTSIEIPDNVTSIGYAAFYGCYGLKSIEIPDSVTTIGDSAFEGCSGLTEMTLPFVGASKAGTSDMHFGYIFGASSYSGNNYDVPTSLKKVTITGGVISSYAFYDCSGLTSIEIPDSVTSIGEYAFRDCSSLTSVVIGNGVTSIGSYAFYGCSSLTSIEIPDSVTTIGDEAFYNCSSLTIYCETESKPSGWISSWNSSRPVVWDCNNNDLASDGYVYVVIDNIRYGIKDGVATVVTQANNIQTANIPASIIYKNSAYSVTSIGSGAFYNCSSLTSIEIPDSVTSIGDYAFWGCSSLTSIEIPDSVTSIGDDAFRNCSGLTSIEIPDSVTTIGEYAFYGCSGLTSIEIPDSVTSIGDDAFYGCSGLTIYCEVASKPSGWDWSWNYSNRPVVWGYKE